MVKVMIVDNEKQSQQEIRQILSQNEIYDICTEYTNAISAMEALEKERPDIVLTNVLMPGITGIELAEYVKKLYPLIQVILMSENLSFAVKGYEVGASGFILKPLIGKRVMETVKRIEMIN